MLQLNFHKKISTEMLLQSPRPDPWETEIMEDETDDDDDNDSLADTTPSETVRMLICLQSGEQRLITFTLPRERFLVADLLKQIGIPLKDNTAIDCIVHDLGSEINFVVKVGGNLNQRR